METIKKGDTVRFTTGQIDLVIESLPATFNETQQPILLLLQTKGWQTFDASLRWSPPNGDFKDLDIVEVIE